MAQMQTSVTLRSNAELSDHGGYMRVLKLDLKDDNPEVMEDRENLLFGHASTLLWTGNTQLALCAAGNVDSSGLSENRWRIGYTCVNTNL